MTRALQIVSFSNCKQSRFSKWQKMQILLDPIEMEHLLQHLSPLYILNISGVVPREEISITINTFMYNYQKYIDMLQGKIPKQKICLSYALSRQIDNFRGVAIAPDKYICRMGQPDVQMQAYTFLLDAAGKILPQVFSDEAICWGIQLSYPAIFQDGHTMEVFHTTRNIFPGWKLFSAIRTWIRNHTVPLPIYFREKVIYLPIRLGKKATTWMASHIDRERIAISESTLSKICQRQTI